LSWVFDDSFPPILGDFFAVNDPGRDRFRGFHRVFLIHVYPSHALFGCGFFCRIVFRVLPFLLGDGICSRASEYKSLGMQVALI
jgi:hypothetical protein